MTLSTLYKNIAMFNFKELKLDRRENAGNLSSFVGIRRNNNALEFRLPKGFQNFPEQDFEATKQLFFKMYRTFKKFEQTNKSLVLDDKAAGKDNIETKSNAYAFKDKEDNDVLLYSKIAVIENLLEAYQDLALDVIERRIGRSEKIDYSQIDRYLHHAIYLPNDVIYLDEMALPRQTLHYDSATIIDLFCFILQELEHELEQDTDYRVKELANRFKEQHLGHDQSLFNEETFESTITSLKDVLDDIDKRTAYKDEDYWRLYEAIESFLYGELDMQNTHEDGIFWGISNFYQIWEDMCNTYAFAHFNDPDKGLEIWFADTNIVFNGKQVPNSSFGGHKLFKAEAFENPFFITFRGEKKWIRPDCVRFEGNSNIFDKNSIEIIDIKKHPNGRLDFNICLKNNLYESPYKAFCSNLKKAIDKNRIQGVRAIGEHSFKNYPNLELDNQKEIIQKIHNKYSRNTLLDWKYMDTLSFSKSSYKIDQDITKQLCYEFALQQSNPDLAIKSQFVIPYFYSNPDKLDNIGDPVDKNKLYHRISDNNIEVFQANFITIQKEYLNHA